ncbi:hypothetical protein X975_10354, partial [Stegodyphus mimosarum]
MTLSKVSVNPLDVCRSVKRSLWFKHSHLSISDIIQITRFWFGRCSNKVTVHKHAVVDWFTLCREVCQMAVIKENVLLGGKEVTVEGDECRFQKWN